MKKQLSTLVFLLVFVFAPYLATITKAQGDVAIRFYVVPITQIGNARYPSHFGGKGLTPDAELANVASWAMMDYGLINTGLIAANVDSAQQTYLAGLADVLVVPANIDNTITTQGQVNAVSNALEAFDIPGTWVNVGDTYRTVLREIAGYFQFMQRLTAITGIDPTTLNIRLSTTYGSLAQTWQDAIVQAANELGYSTAGLNSGTTLRAILRNIASQNDLKTFTLGWVTF